MYPRFLSVFMFASLLALAIVVHGAKLVKRDETLVTTTLASLVQETTASCGHKHHVEMNCTEYMKKSLNATSSSSTSAKLIELAPFMKAAKFPEGTNKNPKSSQKTKRDVIGKDKLKQQDHQQHSHHSHQNPQHQNATKKNSSIGQVLRATISINGTSVEPIDLNITTIATTTTTTTTTEAPTELPNYNLSQIL